MESLKKIWIKSFGLREFPYCMHPTIIGEFVLMIRNSVFKFPLILAVKVKFMVGGTAYRGISMKPVPGHVDSLSGCLDSLLRCIKYMCLCVYADLNIFMFGELFNSTSSPSPPFPLNRKISLLSCEVIKSGVFYTFNRLARQSDSLYSKQDSSDVVDKKIDCLNNKTDTLKS